MNTLSGSRSTTESLDEKPSSNPSDTTNPSGSVRRDPSIPDVLESLTLDPDVLGRAASELGRVEVEEEDPIESLLGFFTSHDIGRAVNLSDWDIEKEIELYVSIAKGELDGTKISDRMTAAERIRRLAFMALRMSGHVTDVDRKAVRSGELPDKTHVSLVTTERTLKLLKDSVSNTELQLREALSAPPIDTQDTQDTRDIHDTQDRHDDSD